MTYKNPNCPACSGQNPSCLTCNRTQPKASCPKERCGSAEWIDTHALKHKFGQDNSSGLVTVERYFPGWLINYCPPEYDGKGYQDPCSPNVFYKWEDDGFVYKDTYCGNALTERVFLKDGLINDCAIRSLDASKITNPCGLFQSGLATNIADPTKGYLITGNGQTVLNPNISLLDVVYTNGAGGNGNSQSCQLKTVISRRDIRKAILPDLVCLGVSYNENNDTVQVDPGLMFTGTAFAVDTSTTCRRVRFNYVNSPTATITETPEGVRVDVNTNNFNVTGRNPEAFAGTSNGINTVATPTSINFIGTNPAFNSVGAFVTSNNGGVDVQILRPTTTLETTLFIGSQVLPDDGSKFLTTQALIIPLEKYYGRFIVRIEAQIRNSESNLPEGFVPLAMEVGISSSPSFELGNPNVITTYAGPVPLRDNIGAAGATQPRSQTLHRTEAFNAATNPTVGAVNQWYLRVELSRGDATTYGAAGDIDITNITARVIAY